MPALPVKEEGQLLRNDIVTTTCRRFTRSMTMARQKEISLCSDNDTSDDEVQQNHLEERVNDVTDRTDDTDNGISWNYSEERDNNEDENMSWDYSEERDDNEDGDDPDNNNRITLPTNAVALHRKALPPLRQLVISKFATQNTRTTSLTLRYRGQPHGPRTTRLHAL
jgi:lipopolysaccharide export LptBFGC system permease protein LptF